MNKEMIVFMGGQGSGKGTFAGLIMKEHEYKYVETGAILRSFPVDSVIGRKICSGELLPDKDLFDIISKHIDKNEDIILDGFPRTIGQAKWLIDNYTNIFNIKIIYLNISEETMIKHINKRILEGGNRKDDTDKEAVQRRLDAFKNTTMPAIKWLQQIKDIDFYDIKLPSDIIDVNYKYIMSQINKNA